ncbi:type VI secretion system protein [Sphaerotilus hippei]|uniref:Type VI secretion system protein n=1 Tax=Sphaerotilus hippei TaxID=744406 RepID=A0A318H781_9BURK|nr:hypothetical protein [Sphaerotilus hippei]PXW97485.1 type VI secretion system protein [Sphaerotilus hippei]
MSHLPFFSRAPAAGRLLRLACGLAALALAGCGTVGGVASVLASSTANAFSAPPGPAYLDWKGLLVVADADANQNSPVALDIVFVRDMATLERLGGLSAARWFATRTEQLSTDPDGLTVRSVELVPRQVLRLPEKELGSPRVAGVLLFADYMTPGEHRARLPKLPDGTLVRLGARTFTLSAHAL